MNFARSGDFLHFDSAIETVDRVVPRGSLDLDVAVVDRLQHQLGVRRDLDVEIEADAIPVVFVAPVVHPLVVVAEGTVNVQSDGVALLVHVEFYITLGFLHGGIGNGADALGDGNLYSGRRTSGDVDEAGDVIDHQAMGV